MNVTFLDTVSIFLKRGCIVKKYKTFLKDPAFNYCLWYFCDSDIFDVFGVNAESHHLYCLQNTENENDVVTYHKNKSEIIFVLYTFI